MTELSLLVFTALGLGFMGSSHCLGMCGGVVASLNSGLIATDNGSNIRQRFIRQCLFNTGRLCSYMLIGGLLGATANAAAEQLNALTFLRVLAALMTMAIGVSITGYLNTLAWLETIGSFIWRYIQPLSRPLLPATRWPQFLLLGLLWGWLPCGLVYSAASYALLAGSFSHGALLMLAFGLGTLPVLLFAGTMVQSFIHHLRGPKARLLLGLALFVTGGFMLVSSLGGHQHGDHQPGAAHAHGHHSSQETQATKTGQGHESHHHHHHHDSEALTEEITQ